MNKFFILGLILLLLSSFAVVSANEINETDITSDNQEINLNDVLIVHEENLKDLDNTVNKANGNSYVLSTKNDENNIENENCEQVLKEGNEIQSVNLVRINSTEKGLIPLNITGLNNEEITGDFNATLSYKEGNDTISIPLNVAYENNFLKFDYPLSPDISSANLEVTYNLNGEKLSKNITLNRIFNAKIEIINNVNEYQSGNFTFKLIDIDNNKFLTNKTLNLYINSKSGIRAGFNAVTNDEGIATFKTSNLYKLDMENNSFTLKPLEVGNHEIGLSTSGAIISGTVKTDLTITKLDINIVIEKFEEEYDSNKTVTINVTNARTGESLSGIILHAYMPNTTSKDYYFQTDSNGQSNINVSGLVCGVYPITVSNNDTSNINYATVNGEIIIFPIALYFKDSDNISEYFSGSNMTFQIVNKLGKGINNIDVLIQFDNDENQKYLLKSDKNGNLVFNPVLTEGKHILSIENVTGGYLINSFTKTVNIKKSINLNISDIKYSQDALIEINVAEEFLDSDIFISISNENGFEKSYHMKVNETIIIKLTELNVSTYFVNVDCINANNFKTSINTTFNVSKLDIGDIYFPKKLFSDEHFTFHIPNDATGTVLIYIDDYIYNIEINDGEVSFPVDEIAEGNYSYRVYYSGDDIYNPFSIESKITILNPVLTISAKDMKVKYGGDYEFIAIFYNSDLNPLSNSNVIFNVNNKDYLVKTDYSGIAILNVGLGNGTYNITSINLLTGEELTNILTVYGEPKPIIKTTIESFSIMTEYNSGKYIIATLKDNLKNPLEGVYVNINVGSLHKSIKTDTNGQIKLSTNGLVPKTYNASLAFEGNANYEKSTAAIKVTIKKATPRITAKAITFKKSVKTKKYSITLKNNLNKVMKNIKVNIKVNKKTYSAKTNSKGVATFKITKLTKKGTFKSIITYKGDKYYNKVTKTINIKIK